MTSPVVGVTKPAQLADAVAAVDVELDEDEAAYLEESFCKRQPARGLPVVRPTAGPHHSGMVRGLLTSRVVGR